MELYSFVVTQGHILLVMFVLGVVLGVGYDGIRVIRRLVDARKVAEYISDLIYWLVVTVIVSVNATMFCRVSQLQFSVVMRFCQLLVGAAGMILYFATISPAVVWILYTPLHFVGKLFARSYRYIGKEMNALNARIKKHCNKTEKKEHI